MVKSRDPNRSISTRAADMSSADDGVIELSVADDGAAEIVNPTRVFPTDSVN